jgi:hypothetical protein
MRAWILRRRWLCAWLAAVLLFGQVTAVAYACPGRAPAPAAVSDGAGEAVAAGGCAGHEPAAMDAADPLRCKAHCQADDQSVNSVPPVTDAPVAPLVLLVRVLDVAQAEALAAAMPVARAAGPPAGTPPIYLSLLALRN